jgi:hypothetical protein
MGHGLWTKGWVVLASALLLPGCGGGGGSSDPSAQTPGPGPTPSARARIEAILEACVLEGVEAFDAVAADFDGVLDAGGAPNPDFRVTSVDLLRASVGWTLDADADGQVDLTGTMRFVDAGGSPTLPFTAATILALVAGTADLASLLATLPDGTTVAIDYATVRSPVPVSGTFETTFVAGQPATVSGEATFDGAACETRIAFEDLPAAPLFDPAPAGSFDVLVTTAEGVLEGALTLNGDGTATIDVALDGADRSVWDYDLSTGALTPRP